MPRIPASILKRITEYFPDPAMSHQLDPSYEQTNDPTIEHIYTAPYAEKEHVDVFKALQQMQDAGLVTPVDEEYMYWAAMKGKSCRLTPLGAHYWRLVSEKKI